MVSVLRKKGVVLSEGSQVEEAHKRQGPSSDIKENSTL